MTDNRNLGSIALGLGLIGLGGLLLIAQLLSADIWTWLWPFGVIGMGLLFFLLMLANGPQAGGLAVPGSIITTVGLILFTLNVSGHWEAWAYAWPLIIVAVGVGTFIQGVWSNLEKARREGPKVARVGVVLFLVFGAFFELFIFRGYDRYSGLLWPLLLIGLGLYFVLGQLLRRETLLPPPSPDWNPPIETPLAALPPVAVAPAPPAASVTNGKAERPAESEPATMLH